MKKNLKIKISDKQLEIYQKIISHTLSKSKFDMNDSDKMFNDDLVSPPHPPILLMNKFETEHWSDDIKRTLGITKDDISWEWAFGSIWKKTDNSLKNAIYRLKYLIEYGLPENWKEIMEGKDEYPEEIKTLINNTKTMEITVEYLEDTFGTDVSRAYLYLSGGLSYPQKPTKPILKRDHTSQELSQYNSLFKDFETQTEIYDQKLELYNKERSKIESLMKNYIIEISGFNTIPEQYRNKVYALAYENGHSNGFSEIYNHLVDLVEIFN